MIPPWQKDSFLNYAYLEILPSVLFFSSPSTSVDFFIREQKPTSKEWLPTKTHKKSSSILTQKLPYITMTVLEGLLPGK